MELTGTQTIPAARPAVWEALNDPAVLKRCLPGCESVERLDGDAFKVIVAAAIGPLRPRFNGTLRLTEAVVPESCVMVFEGQGGPVGFGQGSSSVTLRDTPDGGTELSYAARAQVGGKLAQVGSRLIDSVAKKLSDDFFKAFLRQFKPVDEPGETAAERAPAPSPSATPEALPAPAAVTPTQPGSVPRIEERPARVPVAALPGPTLVPGWWLAIAAALGSALTLAGLLAAH